MSTRRPAQQQPAYDIELCREFWDCFARAAVDAMLAEESKNVDGKSKTSANAKRTAKPRD